jgi:ABC-type enterochelin transport system substrate-binding protein
MKKNIRLIIGGFAVLAVLLSCTNSPKNLNQASVSDVPALAEPQQVEKSESTEGNPEITFETLEANFGTIKQGDSFEYDFEFTNTGDADLLITSARGSCGCTVPEYPREPIAPGAKAVIHVKFNSAGKSQQQTKTVTLNTNASPDPITLYIKGFVEVPN